MKKFLSVFLSIMLLLTTATSLTACNNGGSSGDVTVLEVSASGMGMGTDWIESLFDRFEQEHTDKHYAEGKTGVEVSLNPIVEDRTDIRNDGNSIYLSGALSSPATYVRSGSYLNINDIVTEDLEVIGGKTVSIEDKIPEETRSYYKVNNEYYALPAEEYHSIVSYDKHLFDTYGLYFAKPGATGRPYQSTVCQQQYTLINIGDNANKSCGPDGEYGTADDGLPSSLYELAGLCEIMKKYFTISPFALTGQYKEYCNALLDALMTSLQGYNANAMYSLKGETFDIITGWTNENLFPGINYLKKPIVKTIPITEETGYYTTWSADKYYAEAFVELIQREGWWFSGTKLGTKSHINTQADFIYSGYGSNEKIGMLVEYSYWWNEATENNSFKYFYSENRDVTERDIAIMSLPINLDKTVTEHNGENPVLLVCSQAYIAVNSNISNDPEMLAVVKDFIKFIYTDEQLSLCTVQQGLPRSLNYEIKSEHQKDFNSFAKSLSGLAQNGKKITTTVATVKTVLENESLFKRGFTDGAFSLPGKQSCFLSIYDGVETAKSSFEKQMINKTQWVSYYKGDLAVGDYNGIIYN